MKYVDCLNSLIKEYLLLSPVFFLFIFLSWWANGFIKMELLYISGLLIPAIIIRAFIRYKNNGKDLVEF